MIENLVDYFDPEQTFFLDEISYKRIVNNDKSGDYTLNCNDNIEVQNNRDTVKLTIRRELEFDPSNIFILSISYGAILKFKEARKDDYDWSKINLAEEFRMNGQFVLDNLMNRISLIIAEITSAAGQSPIIVPPMFAPKNE